MLRIIVFVCCIVFVLVDGYYDYFIYGKGDNYFLKWYGWVYDFGNIGGGINGILVGSIGGGINGILVGSGIGGGIGGILVGGGLGGGISGIFVGSGLGGIFFGIG